MTLQNGYSPSETYVPTVHCSFSQVSEGDEIRRSQTIFLLRKNRLEKGYWKRTTLKADNQQLSETFEVTLEIVLWYCLWFDLMHSADSNIQYSP